MALSKDQIKAIADRATQRAAGIDVSPEPEFKLKTYTCTVCKHEIVRNLALPAKDDVCGQCREKIAAQKQAQVPAPDFPTILELTKEWNKLLENIARMDDSQNKNGPDGG